MNVKVYWDERNPSESAWSYEATDGEGLIGSGGIDADLSLSDAVDEACHQLDLRLTHDDFAENPTIDGGYAVWSSDYES